MWVGSKRTKNLEQQVEILQSAAESWKAKATESQAMADYWAIEAAKQREENKMAFSSDSESRQRELQELLTYWKGVAVAKEKEIEAAHRDIVQLRNDLKQQRFLRGEMQQEINRLHERLTESKKEVV